MLTKIKKMIEKWIKKLQQKLQKFWNALKNLTATQVKKTKKTVNAKKKKIKNKIKK